MDGTVHRDPPPVDASDTKQIVGTQDTKGTTATNTMQDATPNTKVPTEEEKQSQVTKEAEETLAAAEEAEEDGDESGDEDSDDLFKDS